MPDESENYHKYDHAKAIRQQIKHVNHLITGLDTDENQSFQQYFSKAFMALASLEAMVAPFRDDEYTSKLENENPLEKERKDQLKFIYEVFKELMAFLHEENLFYAQRQGRRNL